MISAEVCGTDSFLSLKHKEQALYYQLVLATDDDGFISNPLSIARIAMFKARYSDAGRKKSRDLFSHWHTCYC